MRAEMTVGLDLKKLEDLKIFNGYETKEFERKLSIETPASSPDQAYNGDGDSDYQPHIGSKTKSNGTKQKCGRPANPVPRHKRESHIKAEYKRRDKIQKGFDSLMSMVPELMESSSSKESKSSILFKTAEYCRRLKSEYGNVQSEMTDLRQELDSLFTQIQDLQESLPKQGASVVDKETFQMDSMYDEYVQDKTKKNWKFWIFGFFMKPLYKSYREAVTGSFNGLDFSRAVIDWVKNCLSLGSLRKAFLDSLRKVSTRTDIMTHPEHIQKESVSKLKMHCILTDKLTEDDDKEVVYKVTPTALTYTQKTTPKTTPKQTPKVTPVPTPTPTPPRTPTSTRRNKRRESRVSKDSRSRSNSPQEEGTRLKRRPSNRSEKRHYSGDTEDDSLMIYSKAMPQFTFTQPTGFPAKRVSPVPVEKNISLLEEVTPSFTDAETIKMSSPVTGYEKKFLTSSQMTKSDEKLLTPLTGYEKPFPSSSHTTKSDDKLLTTLIDTLSTFLQTDKNKVVLVDQGLSETSSTVFTCSDVIMSVDHQPMLNATPMEADMESSNASSQSDFLPIDRPGLIFNNSVLSADHSLDSTSETMYSALSPLQYDNYISSQSDSLSVLTLNPSPFPQSMTTSNQDSYASTTICGAGGATVKQEGQDMIESEDDALMKMLTLDVMDVNSLMTFFGNDQTQTKHEKVDC